MASSRSNRENKRFTFAVFHLFYLLFMGFLNVNLLSLCELEKSQHSRIEKKIGYFLKLSCYNWKYDGGNNEILDRSIKILFYIQPTRCKKQLLCVVIIVVKNMEYWSVSATRCRTSEKIMMFVVFEQLSWVFRGSYFLLDAK